MEQARTEQGHTPELGSWSPTLGKGFASYGSERTLRQALCEMPNLSHDPRNKAISALSGMSRIRESPLGSTRAVALRPRPLWQSPCA